MAYNRCAIRVGTRRKDDAAVVYSPIAARPRIWPDRLRTRQDLNQSSASRIANRLAMAFCARRCKREVTPDSASRQRETGRWRVGDHQDDDRRHSVGEGEAKLLEYL